MVMLNNSTESAVTRVVSKSGSTRRKAINFIESTTPTKFCWGTRERVGLPPRGLIGEVTLIPIEESHSIPAKGSS
jgi:hypothetical protein